MAPPVGGMQAFAAMCSHVPNKGEQMARYYGYYSNVARGKRKKADDKIPCILVPELTDKAFRRNWARLIQKIYEVDPLVCPKFLIFIIFRIKIAGLQQGLYMLSKFQSLVSG